MSKHWPLRTSGLEPTSLLFNLNFMVIYSDKIERMAAAGNKAREKTWIGLFGLFANIRTEHFNHSEIEAAWKWIKK